MIVNAGQLINLNLKVTDSNNIAVFDDTPKATIKSLKNNSYFNGLFFVDEEVSIILPHLGEGIYGLDFRLDDTDELEVVMTSDKYNVSKSVNVIVLPKDCVQYCKIGEEFVYFIPMENESSMISYRITNSEGLYYVLSSNSWSEEMTFNVPTKISETLLRLGVTLEEGTYSVEVLDKDKIIFMFNLAVTNESNKGEITVVNSSNLKFLDGTDTILLTEDNTPLAGVKVTATNTETKLVESTSTTNGTGEWHMVIPRGSYLFTFEKQGFSKVSFLKEV